MTSRPATDDLVAALAGAGVTDVSTSPGVRATHSRDASLYRVVPQLVAHPRHPDELDALVHVARETGTPLTARGAGTSIAGNAVGPGIVVDTTRHLHRVLSVDAEAGLAVVQPGVVHAVLQGRARQVGRLFGPDPSTHTRCTVGGMVGNNACGSRALGHGRTSDNVEALDVVWGNGERQLLAADARAGTAGRLADLAAADLAGVRTGFGRFSRQVSGYACEHLLPERLRPDRFLVGSEGTLALVREATVRLLPVPGASALVLLGYGSILEAADATAELLGLPGLTACEGLDQRITRLVRHAPDLPAGSGWLFVEVTGDAPGQVADRVAAVLAAGGTTSHRVVTDAAEAAALWRIREDGAGLAARSLDRPAHAGWEDAAVPPARLGAWLREFEDLLAAHRLHGVPYGHFGDGCVHVRIDFELTDPTGRARFREFLTACAPAVAAHGGSMSGEHGDGRARSELLPLMYPPAAMDLFAQVKRVADPDGVLNPGVLVDPAPFDADLAAARPRSVTGGRLVADLGEVAHRCTGVGKCVAVPGTASVMCPTWQATGREADSTRGRARLLAEALDTGSDRVLTGLDDDAVVEALDLCLGCKGCSSDCPTGVDVAALRSQTLQQRYHGWRTLTRPRHHHVLGRLPQLLDSPLRGLVGLASRDSGTWLGRALAGLAGIDPERRLPAPEPRAARRTWPLGPDGDTLPDVWLWADSFSQHFGSQVVEAAVAVLADAGLRARVLPVRACCGLTLVSTGQLDAATTRARAAVRRLAPHLASGVPLVGLEPSCTATLRSDVLRLVGDPSDGPLAELVAGRVRTLAEVLVERLDAGWQPPSLAGVEVVAQPHCHQHAVSGWAAERRLLQATGATVVELGGCCGMAGDYGMVPEHRQMSRAVAGLQLLPALRAHPDAVLLADGFSCRTQADDLAARPARHLAELLRPGS